VSALALARALERINEGVGRAVAWLVLALVGVTFAVVVLRYGFRIGSVALQETIIYLHALIFMLGAAYTLLHDAHVRVDIFYRRFSPRMRAWVNLLGTVFLLLPVTGFILIESLDFVARAWSLREGSMEPGGLPLVYLLKTVIPVTAILLSLQGIASGLRQLALLRGELPAEGDR
jgi:TRAP-type mannitol/chloroaromatic compound transport system permease small subunit